MGSIEKAPTEEKQSGLAFAVTGIVMQKLSSFRLARRNLTELQRLRHDGLFVMSDAARQADCSRDDDRASY
jgi:hypothetical protein